MVPPPPPPPVSVVGILDNDGELVVSGVLITGSVVGEGLAPSSVVVGSLVDGEIDGSAEPIAT